MSTLYTIMFRGGEKDFEMICNYLNEKDIQYRNMKNNKCKYLTDKERLEAKRNKSNEGAINYYYTNHDEILKKRAEKSVYKTRGRPKLEKPISPPKPKGRPRTIHIE